MFQAEDVKKLAKMVRISIDDDRAQHLAKDFDAIFGYVDQLKEVDTSGVDARAYLADSSNVWADDVLAEVSKAEHAAGLAAFPKRSGNLLEVPGVFE